MYVMKSKPSRTRLMFFREMCRFNTRSQEPTSRAADGRRWPPRLWLLVLMREPDSIGSMGVIRSCWLGQC